MKFNKQKLKKQILGLLVLLTVLVIYLFVEFFVEEKLVGGTEFFPEWFMVWDRYFFLLINKNFVFQPLDWFFMVITHVGLTYVWFAFSAFLWFKKRKTEALLLFITIILTSLIILPEKIFIPRARPFQVLDARIFWIEEGYSFPSGHTKNIFVAATILSKKNKKIRFPMYFLAIVVGLSRIYLGLHWPSDVLTGALIGWLTSLLILNFENKILDKFGLGKLYLNS